MEHGHVERRSLDPGATAFGSGDGHREPMSQTKHTWTDASEPSVAIVEAIAAATNTPITDLQPLGDVLDTDALDALLRGPGGEDLRIQFSYEGVEVSVGGDGDIVVRS